MPRFVRAEGATLFVSDTFSIQQTTVRDRVDQCGKMECFPIAAVALKKHRSRHPFSLSLVFFSGLVKPESSPALSVFFLFRSAERGSGASLSFWAERHNHSDVPVNDIFCSSGFFLGAPGLRGPHGPMHKGTPPVQRCGWGTSFACGVGQRKRRLVSI